MKKEFNLSEEILNLENDLGLKIRQDTRDVQGINIKELLNLHKEAVKILKEMCRNKWLRNEEELIDIDKIFGEKLI